MKLDIFFKTILSKVHLSRVKVSPTTERLGTRALLHWKILVATSLVSVILVFASSYLIYQDVNQGDFVAPVNKVNTENTKAAAELLKKTADFFRTKSQEFNSLRQNRATSIDPSK